MAAQWMLRRRGLPARLTIGILPPAERGTDDDLHAWVAAGTDTIVGELPFSYRPILALQCC
jgi:transglutaminase-like putative cysteine protease